MYDEVLPKKLRDKILRELKVKPAKSLKHEAGPDHDQADHGSWARGAAGLSVDQAQAVSSYYGNGYSIVNEYLRSGTQPDPGENEFGSVEKFAEHLDLAIEKAGPTAKPYTLYRGISTEYLGSLTPGAVFQEDAFASFSKEPRVAEEFAAPEHHSSGSGLVLQLELPAGSKALDMAKVNFSAGLSDEDEMLLPRGSQFEIISPAIPVTNQDDGDWNETTNYVKIRLIPPAKSLKHEAGPDHDQADHGNWARGGVRLNEYDGKFKAAGGTLESKTVVSPKDSRSEREKIERLRDKVIDMRDGLERGSDQDRELKTIIEGYRMMDLAFQSQVDYASNTAVITAKDSNGKIVGALSYYAPEDYPQITAQFLGTSHEVAGTGTALMREAMQLALDGNKSFAVLDPLEQARPWYESLGLGPIVTRPDSLGGSKELYTANPDKLKEILGSSVKSLKHGDHDQSDHGNWATGGGFSRPNAEDVRRTKINAMFSKTTEPMYWVNGSAQSRDQTFLALDAYTHWNPGDGGKPFHHELNDALRSGSSISKASKDVAAKYGDSDDPEDVKKMRGDLFSGFREIDQLLKESKMIEDTVVLRQSTFAMTADGWANVVSGGPLEIYGMTIEPGAIISDSGYVSTSSDTSGQSTQYFGANFPPGTSYSQDNAPVSVKWDITVPKGAPALDLKALGYSSNHGEGEILLPRNTHFRIDSYEAMPQTMPGAPVQLKVSATVIPTHYP